MVRLAGLEEDSPPQICSILPDVLQGEPSFPLSVGHKVLCRPSLSLQLLGSQEIKASKGWV